VGSGLIPDTGRSRGIVGRWNPEFQLVEPVAVDPELDVRLLGVAVAGDDVWAVGWISDGAGGGHPRIERYSRQAADKAGEAVAAPAVDRDSALHAVDMLSATEGWAVGGSGSGSGADFTQTLIARWDGSTWRVVPSPSPGTLTNRLDAVAARSTDDVWAVGHSTSAGSDSRADALVLHWDGSTWAQVPIPDVTTRGAELLGVAVAGPDSVWAVGTNLAVDSDKAVRQVGIALHWDGSSWRSVLREPTPVTQLSGVTALSETDVWFAGYAVLPGGPETTHIEHWDGRRLQAEIGVSPGLGHVASALSAICAAGDRLVAVGWRITTATAAPIQLPAALLGRHGMRG
jgi:hypothetical protein